MATQDWQAESGRLLLGCFPGNVYSWSWLHIVTNGLDSPSRALNGSMTIATHSQHLPTSYSMASYSNNDWVLGHLARRHQWVPAFFQRSSRITHQWIFLSQRTRLWLKSCDQDQHFSTAASCKKKRGRGPPKITVHILNQHQNKSRISLIFLCGKPNG